MGELLCGVAWAWAVVVPVMVNLMMKFDDVGVAAEKTKNLR